MTASDARTIRRVFDTVFDDIYQDEQYVSVIFQGEENKPVSALDIRMSLGLAAVFGVTRPFR